MLRSLYRLSGLGLLATVALILMVFVIGSHTAATTYILLSAPDRETLETDLILYDARTGSYVHLLRDTTLRAAVPVPGSGEILLHQRESNQSHFRLFNPHSGVTETILSGNIDTPRWSPDGRWLAYRSTDAGIGGLWVMERNSGAQTRLMRRAPGVFAWSPDSEQLVYVDAFTQTASLATVTLDGEQQIIATPDIFGVPLIDNLIWMGDHVLFTSNLALFQVDLATGEASAIAADDPLIHHANNALMSITLDLNTRYGWNINTYLAGDALLGTIPLERFNVRALSWVRNS